MSLKLLFIFLFCLPLPLHAQQLILIINPAGDAQNAGRTIDDYCERAITLHMAQALKTTLEARHGSLVRVLLTRSAGQTLEPLQNANYVNRLNADLFLSIHCYHELEAKPHLSLFQFCYQPVTDFWQQRADSLVCTPYIYAHRSMIHISKRYGTLMTQQLQQPFYQQTFECQSLMALPFKPLLGIQVPALGIECGLQDHNAWHAFIEPLADAVSNLIITMKRSV
jgi:N-acetylmuramoyl-L-alanine amidase